jgi:DNA polymerase-3 subunit epsilon
VLHGLLDLGGRLGILTLGDLHGAVRARGRPHYAKIRLADALPRSPGVYVFRGTGGRVLYVGKARDLRSRVKSYFYGDDRRQVADLLAELREVDARPCRSELEALVLEARLIREHEPKYNRRGREWRRFAYVKLDLADAYPRLKVVREVRDGDVALGPFPSRKVAQLAREALEDAFPIRRCSRAMRPGTRFSPCALADIGRCLAPCDGRVTPERYGEPVRSLLHSLSSPDGLLGALERRLERLAEMQRFEEAASLRDRLRAIAEALAKARVDRWMAAGTVVVRDRDGREHRLDHGSLASPALAAEPLPLPYPRERATEVGAVRSWVLANAERVERADPPLAEPVAGGRALHQVLGRLRAAQDA